MLIWNAMSGNGVRLRCDYAARTGAGGAASTLALRNFGKRLNRHGGNVDRSPPTGDLGRRSRLTPLVEVIARTTIRGSAPK